MPQPAESLGIHQVYSSIALNLLKATEILSDTTVKRFAVDREDLKLPQ